MSNLRDTDQFIVKRNDNYYSAEYSTVISGLETPNAKQGDQISGVAGKLFPSNAFYYDENTGFLDITFPQSLNFVGQVTEDYDEPVGPKNSGDFYIVAPNLDLHPSGSLRLFKSKWPGIDDQEYTTLDITNGGGDYKGSYGVISALGDGVEIALQNITNPGGSYGLVLSSNLIDGGIDIANTTVNTGGNGYSVGDVIRIKQLVPEIQDPDCAYIRVTAVASGSVVDFVFVTDEDGDDEYVYDLVGENYFVPKAEVSYSRSVNVKPRNDTITGSGMLVDITTFDGKVTDVTLSSNSGHTGYKTGDRVFVYNHSIGLFGNAELNVTVTTNDTDIFEVTQNDKLIYSQQLIESDGGGVTEVIKWSHVKDSISNVTVTNLAPKTQPNSDEYFNSHLALSFERNPVNSNEILVAIKNCNFDLTDTDQINADSSFSGFMTPEEKRKISTLPDTFGLVTEVASPSNRNQYTGEIYKQINVTDTDGKVGVFLNQAEKGQYGSVAMVSDSFIQEAISYQHSNNVNPGAVNRSMVMSASQVVTNFTPSNYFNLPSVQ